MNTKETDDCKPYLEKRAYRVSEIAEILGIGRSSAYNLIRQGNFKIVHVGSSIRVSRKSFDEWLDQQSE